jgi:hypothetical protein
MRDAHVAVLHNQLDWYDHKEGMIGHLLVSGLLPIRKGVVVQASSCIVSPVQYVLPQCIAKDEEGEAQASSIRRTQLRDINQLGQCWWCGAGGLVVWYSVMCFHLAKKELSQDWSCTWHQLYGQPVGCQLAGRGSKG